MADDILVLLAHPDLRHSRVCRHLAQQLQTLPGLQLRDLYARYPDYWIDVEAERAALKSARLLVWLHPVHWYGATPLLKLWMDEVLGHGWAFGPGGTQLAGKDLLLVTSTGGGPASYHPSGSHGGPFELFLPPYRQTASLCRMRFLEPMVLHDAHRVPDTAVQAFSDALLARLRAHPEGETALWPVNPGLETGERGAAHA